MEGDELSSAEQRQEQMASIQSEINAVPMLSDPVELLTDSCSLVREFAHNEVLFPKVRSLFTSGGAYKPYKGIRYARRDGNCFFRCVSFSLMEHMLTRPELAQDFVKLVQELREPLIKYYGDFVLDFCEVAEETAKKIATGKCSTVEQLYAISTTTDSQYALYFFRYAVSQYIRSHQDDFLPFVMGYNYESVEEFCKAEVDSIESESDNVQLVAFARCFNVHIVVEYLDGSEGGTTTQHTFCGENPHEGVVIALLYRPGHYDLLYT